MAEISLPVFDFRSGVLTPKLKDRVNLEMTKSGVLVGENWLTQLHGPTTFRPGFKYVRPTRRNNIAWFLPFSFDDTESYVLEFTEGYMRIYSDGGIVVETHKDITGATQAFPCEITSNGHGYVTGDEVYIDNVVGMDELNGTFYLVVRTGANTFTLTDLDGNNIDSRLFTAYTSGGESSRVYEIASPYAEEDLPLLKYAQKADLVYIDHPSYMPRKLTRLALTNWTLSTYTRTADPFEQKAITGITQAAAGVVTAVGHGFLTNDVVLIEEVTGMTEVNQQEYTIIKLTDDTFSIVNTTTFTAYVSGGAVILKGSPPATVGFYGGRLFHGGSDNDPDILFGSRSPDPDTGATRYEDFTTGVEADHAVIYALTSASQSSVDRIRFFVGTRQFLGVGSYAGMLKVNGGSDSAPISGTAIESYPVDSYGVANMMPITFGTDILYVQRGNTVLSSFRYSLLSDGFESVDETVQADEITQEGIIQLTYISGKPNRVWMCMNDGQLLSLVYNRSESASAWNTHNLANTGKVITLCGEPQDDRESRLWVCVEREIEGVTRRYVEYMAKNPVIPERDEIFSGSSELDKITDDTRYNNLLFESQKRQVFLDSAMELDTVQTSILTPTALTGTNVEFRTVDAVFSATDVGRRIQVKHITGDEAGIAQITSYVTAYKVNCTILQDFVSTDPIPSGGWYFTQDTVSGLNHLEGQMVSIVADGGVEELQEVVDGAVTLAGQSTYVIVGLPHHGRLKTMPLEMLLNVGITPGKDKTVNAINLMFRNSLGVSYGYDPYNLQQIGFRLGGQITDRPTRLFNGVQTVPGFDVWDVQRFMWIIQTTPYPCTINSMIFDIGIEFAGG